MSVFSGSIYALVLLDTPKLGMLVCGPVATCALMHGTCAGALTPMGGVLMLAGWSLLAYRAAE